MRYAIVSDVHANLQAWEAVMDDVAVLQIDQIICLGDIVGYGPDPGPVLDAIRQRAAVTVVGNHDAAACGRMDTSLFNDNAREAIEWTSTQLPETDLDYLRKLPASARPDGTDFLIVHAEMVDPLSFGYILSEEDARVNFAACEDPLVFIGHSHRAGVFVQTPSGEISIHDPLDFSCDPQNRYIINPGSIGDPRSTSIVASYVVYDDVTRDVYFRRLEFDIDAYRASMDATGLVTRPFFLRYLDELASGGVEGQCSIPSVQDTDGTPQLNLTAPAIEIKKKDPFVRVGVVVLLVAMVTGIWFFSQNSKSADSGEKTPDLVASKKGKGGSDSSSSKAKTREMITTKKPPEVVSQFPVKARFVRISLPRKGVLSLAEVEVYSGSKNIAAKGKATQSSNFDREGTADKAIDGNTSGRYTDRHMTHTKGEDKGWWLLDLGKEHPIDQLVLWNRDEGGSNKDRLKLRKRLHNYTLELLDEQKRVVFLRKNNPGINVRNLVK